MLRLFPLAALGASCLTACASRPAPIADVTPAADSTGLAQAVREIAPLFAQMTVAANAHDTDAHLAFYLHSPELMFVVNDERIAGWDSLRVRQLQWWQNGKSDATYSVVGEPSYRMLAPGLVVETYALRSRRAASDGTVREAGLGVTDIWQKRAEGWRVIYAHESLAPRA